MPSTTTTDSGIDDHHLPGTILIFAASSYLWHQMKKATTQQSTKRRRSRDDHTTKRNKQQRQIFQPVPHPQPPPPPDFLFLKHFHEQMTERRRLSFSDMSKSIPPIQPTTTSFERTTKLSNKRLYHSDRFDHHFDFDHDYQSIDEESFESNSDDEGGKDMGRPSMVEEADRSRRKKALRWSASSSSSSTYTRSNNNHDYVNYGNNNDIFDGSRSRRPSPEHALDYVGLPEESVFGAHTENYDDGVSSSFSKVREVYNSKIMPRRLIFIRHGQSEGNVDETLYTKCPDSNIRLTKLGWEQAKMSGKILRKHVLKQKNASIHFIVSPYIRCMETFHGLVSAWCNPNQFSHIKDEKVRLRLWYQKLAEMGITFNEDPRIREQDFGNYQNRETIKKAKAERHKFGIFYYRFPNGESASDVFDRISTFFDSLWRSFCSNPSKNYVLVTHGISIRVLLARYFRYTVDQFNVLVSFIMIFITFMSSSLLNHHHEKPQRVTFHHHTYPQKKKGKPKQL